MAVAWVLGAELYYERHGEGPALLFAHGVGGNALSWWQQVPYFRDRYSGNSEQGINVGQQIDSFLISPSYTGTIGPIRALAQFSAVVGSADGNNFTDCEIALGFQRCDYDIFAWAVVAHLEANLLGGVIRPFLGLIWGSGDDDPRDDDQADPLIRGERIPHFPSRRSWTRATGIG